MAERSLAERWWWQLLLIGVWGGLLLTFWPGMLSYDSLIQIQQGRTGQYDNWHPPLMTWIVGLMDGGHLGARIPILLVITTYVLSWWLLSCRVAAGPRVRWGIILLCVLVLWPPYWALLGVLWKDVWMAIGLLATVSTVLVLAHRRWFALLVLFWGCLFAAALRHNGVIAALPLLSVLCAGLVKPLQWPHLRLWGFVVIIMLMYGVCLWVLSHGLHATLGVRERYPEQQIFWHDIAGISIEAGQNLFRLPPAAALSLQQLREGYSPARGATLFTSYVLTLTEHQEEVRQLFGNWLEAVWHHPWCYLRHRARMFAYQFSLAGEEVCYPFQTGVEENSLGLSYHYSVFRLLVLDGLKRLSILFSGWIYLLLCVAVGIGSSPLLTHKRQHWLIFPLALSVSGGVYGMAYFFISTTCDYRMHYWTVLAAGLGMVFVVLEQTGSVLENTRAVTLL